MSLTRDEWCKVWESITKIDRLTEEVYNGTRLQTKHYKAQLKGEIKFIKDKVQQVIGQME